MKDQGFISLSAQQRQSITADQAWHYGIIPKNSMNGNLEFYIDCENEVNNIKNDLEFLFGKNVTLEPVKSDVIIKTLNKYYQRDRADKQKANTGKFNIASGDFIIDIITEANKINSSDIHFEVYENKCRVRFRIDGRLVERYILNKDDYPALINKIKIKANLDIAEKRLPQDGRIFYQQFESQFDIRVSVLPSLYGEKVVLRLLSKDATRIDLTSLGFNEKQLEEYTANIKKPHGIILISGPTGSGKTTTLYASLKMLNKEHLNILTIEDPIEYTLEGINQVQLKESIGLTFSSALRTFLRQDPDIIMLGEIRDAETAQMAIRAALTGHLVLSTIHTNSAWGTISRLIDMGVPPYLISATLNMSVAQRLVRKLCPECKKEEDLDITMVPAAVRNKTKMQKHFVPVGCDQCYFTGYKGRYALYEIVSINESLSNHIKNSDIEEHMVYRENKIHRLSDIALNEYIAGNTSLEEVYPVLSAN